METEVFSTPCSICFTFMLGKPGLTDKGSHQKNAMALIEWCEVLIEFSMSQTWILIIFLSWEDFVSSSWVYIGKEAVKKSRRFSTWRVQLRHHYRCRGHDRPYHRPMSRLWLCDIWSSEAIHRESQWFGQNNWGFWLVSYKWNQVNIGEIRWRFLKWGCLQVFRGTPMTMESFSTPRTLPMPWRWSWSLGVSSGFRYK